MNYSKNCRASQKPITPLTQVIRGVAALGHGIEANDGTHSVSPDVSNLLGLKVEIDAASSPKHDGHSQIWVVSSSFCWQLIGRALDDIRDVRYTGLLVPPLFGEMFTHVNALVVQIDPHELPLVGRLGRKLLLQFRAIKHRPSLGVVVKSTSYVIGEK